METFYGFGVNKGNKIIRLSEGYYEEPITVHLYKLKMLETKRQVCKDLPFCPEEVSSSFIKLTTG